MEWLLNQTLGVKKPYGFCRKIHFFALESWHHQIKLHIQGNPKYNH